MSAAVKRIQIDDYLRPVRDAGCINSLFPAHTFVHPHVYLTKHNALAATMRLRGIDFECLDQATLESYTKAFAAAFRNFEEDYRIYQYVVKHDQVVLLGDRTNPITADRLAHLEQKGLYYISLFVVVIYEPAVIKPKSKNGFRKRSDELRQQVHRLLGRVKTFQESLQDLCGIQLLDSKLTFTFLRFLASLNHNRANAVPLRYQNNIDVHMASSGVMCARKGGIRVDRAHVEVMSLKTLPRQTFPNVFRDLLSIRSNFVLCTEFKRIPNDQANKIIGTSQGHFKVMELASTFGTMLLKEAGKFLGDGSGHKDNTVADKSAVQDVDELGDSRVRINNGGEYMGKFSLTAVFYDWEDRARLAESMAKAESIVGNHEGQLIPEYMNALAAYFSIIPGNTRFSKHRAKWMLSGNYADLCFFYAPSPGECVNPHLKAEYQVVFETNQGTPAYFNMHEDDLLGVGIYGRMGSGKSFLTNLLIEHSLKYNPITVIIDVGNSYYNIVKQHGGSYLALKDHHSDITINPFALEKTDDVLDFLSAFVHILMHTAGYTPTPKECRMIDKAVKKATRLSELDLPEELREHLYNWMGEGRYAYLFDNEKDTLDLSDFQCFDFQGVSPKVVEPLFFYLFQRIFQKIYDPANRHRFKQVWADECWKFITTPKARDRFIEIIKTARKHNGGLGLITQALGDLKKVRMLDIVEHMPTSILLANPNANMKFYQRVFHLNEQECEMFAGLQKKKQILVKTDAGSRVLNIDADPKARWRYANDPHHNPRRDEAIALYGREEAFKQLAAQEF